MLPLQVLKKQIEGLGLIVLESPQDFFIIKPKGLPGNKIDNWNNSLEKQEGIEYTSDCPFVRIWYAEGQFGMRKPYLVEQWEWIPGPGPGDFMIGYDTIEECYDLIKNYFFEENDHFNKRKYYEENKHEK